MFFKNVYSYTYIVHINVNENFKKIYIFLKILTIVNVNGHLYTIMQTVSAFIDGEKEE